MSKRSSLENYALFYEQVGRAKPDPATVQERQDNSYDKACMEQDQLARLANDLQPSTPESSQSKIIQS